MRRLLLALLLCVSAALGADPFPIRGALPWHNFLSGPTAWDEGDWERYLDGMKALNLNLLALHCYTGGAQRYMNYVEPMIRITYRGVTPEATFDTSLTARWGYRPLAVSDFAFGTGRLFQLPAGVRAFGSRAAVLPQTNAERYQHAQALIRRVFAMAHARGIQVAMGFEFGVYPPELFSLVPNGAYLRSNMLPDPTHPSSMEILKITIDNILEAYPGLDWIWLWVQEHEAWPGRVPLSPALQELVRRDGALFEGDENVKFTGAWSLAFIRAAHNYVKRRAPKVRLALGGWGGETQLTPLLAGLDRGLPKDIVFTCLNPGQGSAPQPAVLADIAKHRETWAIPWLEGDAKLWHPQPRVSLMREHVKLARDQGLHGVVAIHWRTEETRANMKAFAQFARDPADTETVEGFYEADAREQFGEAAAKELGALLTRMDKERWLAGVGSPVYYPYDPGWGRLKADQRARIEESLRTVERARSGARERGHAENIEWLAADLRFTLRLDEVSAALEPAYRLKDGWSLDDFDPGQVEAARKTLETAPLREMFAAYAAHVRSRGELGVLSSLNQRVWLQYVELKEFLASVDRPGRARAGGQTQ